MKFIINGDFSLPLNYLGEINKIFFLITDSGGLNLDGILRFWMKLPLSIVFYISESHVITSYFYILYVYLILGFGIYYFFKTFFPKEKKVFFIPILFFLVNPIFLGNFSKIGLVLGAGMLPLIIVFIYKYFQKNQFKYLLPLIVFYTFSLVHPYTFLVNFIVGISYFGYLLYKKESKSLKIVCKDLVRFLFIFLVFSSYFIIAIITTTSSFSRTEMNDSFSKEIEVSSDFSSGVYSFTTQGLSNGFMLSKPILKDYEFYSTGYAPIYFIGVLILLLTILLSFTSKKDKNLKNIFLLLFLGLIALSSGTFGILNDSLAYIVSNLPAGWAFRSPLKWQLYIPFVMCMLLFLTIKNIDKLKLKKITTLLLIGILMCNLFLLKEISQKLLTPKQFEYLANFDSVFTERNVLVVKNKSFLDYQPYDTKFLEEFSILVKSYYIEVSELGLSREFGDNLNKALNSFGFDYIITQKSSPGINSSIKYRKIYTFDNGYELFQNREISEKISEKISNVEYQFTPLIIINGLEIDSRYHQKGWAMYFEDDISLNTPYLNISESRYIDRQDFRNFIENAYGAELDKEGYPIKHSDGSTDYKYYIELPNGSIKIQPKVYFRPQLFYNIGLIISSATLALLVLWFLMGVLKTRKNRKQNV